MKNDFDFIKEKMEDSGVKAPEQLSESAIRALIDDKQPAPIPLKPKRRWAPIAAIAASLVIVASLGVVLGARLIGGGPVKPSPSEVNDSTVLSLKTFDNYDEVKTAVENIRSRTSRDYSIFSKSINEFSAADSFAGEENAGMNSSAASSSHSETYKQVEGVDEADIIKTDGKYIYCVDDSDRRAQVKIFSADTDSPRPVASVNAEEQMASTPDEATPDARENEEILYYSFFSVSNIYLSDNILVLLCNSNDSSGGNETVVQVYDVSDVSRISLLGTHTQSGRAASSRMIGETLYTVSAYYPGEEEFIPFCDGERIACDCVYALPKPNTEGFLVVSSFNTRDFSAQTESKALLGAIDDIYCNENNLYIYATRFDGSDDSWFDFLRSKVTTQIVKVNLTDGLNFAAFGEVKGYVDDQYTLDEYNGNLRVATTSSRGGKDVNNLYVLDENLSIVGSVTGFAKDESIKAVRYMGDTAYVITYEQTDPLFVIDLSDPAAPAILGEAKITGFSTMLVPVGEDLVLGLGFHTENEDYTTLEVQEGFKLALFDVSDKANPKVLDSKSFVDCSSEVQYNPKALVYNPERGDFIVPLNYAHYSRFDFDTFDDAGDPVTEDKDEFYGGMLNFTVEDGQIKVIEHYRADYTRLIERCVYIGDTIYMTHRGSDSNTDLAVSAKKYR